MANITPQLVKELREKTGAGMGDCKNALVESYGDMQAAIEILRKKGAASAAKRSMRSANEGLVVAKTTPDGKSAMIVEINCETDFVARNAEFERYSNEVSDAILNNNPSSIEDLMKIEIANDTIQGLHNEILAKFSENISIRRFDKIQTTGFVASYIHVGSKLGVLIEMSLSQPSEKSFQLIRDIAMQIAAMNPMFVDKEQVSAEKLEKEIEIYKEIAINEGKKPEIAERIAHGRLEKFFQEQCLVEQAFVKDGNKIVKDVIKEISEDAGTEVKVISFKRYLLGESLD